MSDNYKSVDRSNEPEDAALSRRGFFRKAVGGAAVTGVGTFSILAMSRSVHAQLASGGYVWKSIALYRDAPNGPQRCGGCYHFFPPNACQIVESPISPNGWCRYWAPRVAGVRVGAARRGGAGGRSPARERSGY
jgi:hypothetical protein